MRLKLSSSRLCDCHARQLVVRLDFVIKCILVLIACWTLYTLQGVYREVFDLSLDFNDQLKHIKRQLFSDDLFQAVHSYDVPYFINSSIVIVGMAHNHEHSIGAVLRQLDNLSCLFADAAILIFESGSTDRTPHILAEWQAANNTDNTLCEPYTLQSPSPRILKKLLVPTVEPGRKYKTISRLDRYSAFRNFTLQQVLKLGIDFDYMVNIDMDILGIDIKRILTEFHVADRTLNASVMCSNGLLRQGMFYDALATILFDESWMFEKGLIERTNFFYEGDRFTRMISCFGGMAIYRFRDIVDTQCGYLVSREALRRYPELKRYQDLNPPGPLTLGICEHIPFHYCLHQNNRSLYLAKNAYLYYGFSH